MITEKSNWLRLALQLQGSVIPAVIGKVSFYTAFATVIVLIYHSGLLLVFPISKGSVLNIIFNFVLGLLLVFRTNTAYERYWEGRKLWGNIVINTRNLGRKIKVLVDEHSSQDCQEKKAILQVLGAFAITVKLYLREESDHEELKELLSPQQFNQLKLTKTPHLTLTTWLETYIQKQCNQGNLTNVQATAMNELINHLVEGATGCERILKTPMPLAYAIHLKQLLIIYCLLVPFQVVEDFNWWTIPAVTLISFILLGIEAIGIEIENPFGRDPNDLPLDNICQNLLQTLEDLWFDEEKKTSYIAK